MNFNFSEYIFFCTTSEQYPSRYFFISGLSSRQQATTKLIFQIVIWVLNLIFFSGAKQRKMAAANHFILSHADLCMYIVHKTSFHLQFFSIFQCKHYSQSRRRMLEEKSYIEKVCLVLLALISS